MVQRDALRLHYKELQKEAKNETHIKNCKKLARVYYPSICVVFVISFWVLGLKTPQMDDQFHNVLCFQWTIASIHYQFKF